MKTHKLPLSVTGSRSADFKALCGESTAQSLSWFTVFCLWFESLSFWSLTLGDDHKPGETHSSSL